MISANAGGIADLAGLLARTLCRPAVGDPHIVQSSPRAVIAATLRNEATFSSFSALACSAGLLVQDISQHLVGLKLGWLHLPADTDGSRVRLLEVSAGPYTSDWSPTGHDHN